MKTLDNLCMGCMNDLENEYVCSKCGEKRGEPQETPFLPKKFVIGSRYIIGKGLEVNGEGLSYIGYDKVKGLKVYIREFFPENLCSRGEDFINVRVSSYKKGMFEKEFEKFLKYFRSVARLRNIPALCAIYDIFKENNTAYIIMEWIDGISLDKFVAQKGGAIPWNEVRLMFMPLISALSGMHKSGVLHLGISPENLLIEDTGKIRLTGFAMEDLRKMNSPLEPQLYDGCSALEQYVEIYDMDQSTDVYSLTASLFLALTGEYPQIATKRKKDDRLFMPKEIVSAMSDTVISGLASGLRVYPNNRTLSFDRLKIEISNSNLTQFTFEEKKKHEIKKEKQEKIGIILGVKSCVATLLVLIFSFVFYSVFVKKYDYNFLTNENFFQNFKQEETSDEAIENKRKITVPNLREKNFEDLQSLDNINENYEVLLLSEEFNDDIPSGCIISQTPGAGEEVYEGAIIAVNVSKGSKMRKLPAVKEKTISEAAIAVSSVGVRPAETWSNSEDIPEGYVIDYADRKEGDMVEYDSEVILVRSSGKA